MRTLYRRTAVRLTASLLSTTGLIVTAVDGPASAASSDCTSGYVCLWSGSAYTGTIKRFGTSGQMMSTGLTYVGSLYNHRASRVWLYEYAGGSGRSYCLNPGSKLSVTSGWLTRAQSIYLSTVTSC